MVKNSVPKEYYIIDFDSTFTQVEALDELVRISLEGSPHKDEVAAEISRLTNCAMNGTLSFKESLEKRIALLGANKEHLAHLVKVLKQKVSTSFARNKAFLRSHNENMIIVSGGFREFILPVVKDYGLLEKNVYANTFTFDDAGNITGFDPGNPLSEEGGKVKLLKQLNLQGLLYGLGDGYSDYQLKESGLISRFFAFTENISREKVTRHADYIAPSFDEFLYIKNLPRAISYPKNRILCLCVGELSAESSDLFKEDGLSVRLKPGLELKYRKDIGMLLLGSEIEVTEEELKTCEKLKVIGCLGDPSKQVPLATANRMGIVVFGDPKEHAGGSVYIPRRMINFINTGSTWRSTNFPQIRMEQNKGTHRFIHIHANKPGVIASINLVLSTHQMNIEGQFLKTNEALGYVITDVNKIYDDEVIADLKGIRHTLKFRVLY